MKAWLKGGLIFVGIFYLIPLLVSILLFSSFSQSKLTEIYSTGFFGGILTFITFPQLIAIMFFGQLGYIILPLLWFLLGALIGWIVGKMRNRE